MDGFVRTDDDIELRYTDEGTGRPVVFVHAWEGCAEQWAPAAMALGTVARVVTYDQRGHGRSHDAACGWTVHRLGRDLDQLLTGLGLVNAILVGHSLGCSVIWAYLELFGPGRLGGLVLVEPSPALVADPVWDQETIDAAGALFTDAELRSLCHSLADPESGERAIRRIVRATVSPNCAPDLVERIVTWNSRVDGRCAAGLLSNHAHHDWRPQIARIGLPTLVVAGRASLVPWTAARWVAGAIPGARLEIFEPHEGGSHQLTLENPAKFNGLLLDFIS
jgi:pimeloyl-ACP methyl ester carboxylesterase